MPASTAAIAPAQLSSGCTHLHSRCPCGHNNTRAQPMVACIVCTIAAEHGAHCAQSHSVMRGTTHRGVHTAIHCPGSPHRGSTRALTAGSHLPAGALPHQGQTAHGAISTAAMQHTSCSRLGAAVWSLAHGRSCSHQARPLLCTQHQPCSCAPQQTLLADPGPGHPSMGSGQRRACQLQQHTLQVQVWSKTPPLAATARPGLLTHPTCQAARRRRVP